jgi:hypothetical protein
MAKLALYEATLNGVKHTYQLTEEDAERIGAKKVADEAPMVEGPYEAAKNAVTNKAQTTTKNK